MALSNRTIAALAEVIATAYSQSQISVLQRRFDFAGLDATRNKLDRALELAEWVNSRADNDQNAVALARELFEVKYKDHLYDRRGELLEHLSRLVESLRVDGFELADGRLVPTTPAPSTLAPELTLLERELRARGFEVALAHFQQAVDSFVDSRLEAANGQLRSFLEDLLLALHEELVGSQANSARSAAERLRNDGHLDGDEVRLLLGLLGVSNNRGAHSGLTDGEEALFRLHFTSATGRYLLARTRT